MKNKKLTVTVGIPAYNESANIINLLNSILKQKGRLFFIEKIIVICDGCTDETAQKVQKLAGKKPLIQLINSEQRLGQAGRHNELYQLNKSDILVTFDADILLERSNEIEEMIRLFDSNNVVVVSGNPVPVENKTLIGKIIRSSQQIWDETRLMINNGNHIHNFWGCATAIRKSFLEYVNYPTNLPISYSQFLYVLTIKHKKLFRYAKNSRILYCLPNNLKDYQSMATRSINNKHIIAHYFGDWVYPLYEIPSRYKAWAICKMLLSYPIFTTLAILLNWLVRVFPKKNNRHLNGFWEIVTSTKMSIIR